MTRKKFFSSFCNFSTFHFQFNIHLSFYNFPYFLLHFHPFPFSLPLFLIGQPNFPVTEDTLPSAPSLLRNFTWAAFHSRLYTRDGGPPGSRQNEVLSCMNFLTKFHRTYTYTSKITVMIKKQNKTKQTFYHFQMAAKIEFLFCEQSLMTKI